MSPEERLALIQARTRHAPINPPAKPKGLHIAANPQLASATRKRPKQPANGKVKKFRSDLFGISLTPPTRRNVWVKEPDPNQPGHVRHSRRWVKNPLCRIAEQLPVKLPKLSRL